MKEIFYLHADFKRNKKGNMEGDLEFHIQVPAHNAAQITKLLLDRLASHDPLIVDAAVSKYMEERIKQ